MPNEKLPEQSFATLKATGEVIMVKRGEMGYYPMKDAYMTADELNEEFEVTKAQAQAMYNGSMFGWNVPAANPDNYDEDGNFIKKEKEFFN